MFRGNRRLLCGALRGVLSRGVPLCVVLSCGVLLSAAPAVSAEDVSRDDGPRFDLGGAVRFNYGWLDYGPTSGLQPELLRIDAKGDAGPAFFSLQYRWYDGFDAVHHAWAGWKLGDGSDGVDADIRVGIQQVPFGLLPYASNSFWFGSGYYLGIEDDYDPGIVWQRADDTHQWHAGVFAGDEYGTGSRFDRYSFDVATTGDLPYRERGRAVVRYQNSRTWNGAVLALGASTFAGRIENRASGDRHGHAGVAVHGQWSRGPATVQLQWARYRYANPESRIALSAFLFPFEIASQADVPTFNVAWDAQRTGWFDSIACYNNASATLPVGRDPGLRNSIQNVTGCSFGKGPMLAYVDWIAGRNMWFVGGPGVGIDAPGGDRWRSRLNVNIGFYF
ncbi:OprO/OprP family phosphate-selective porin [Luteimonas sp. BDR2-5]|uniref:OprO/OprP family phosphate-selective porin n=1 Tax=Proluteimonas luteida TaxID=2878685 RepID=UPI001E331DAD|nr:OprO/OprP family phosphate-selective porin [Luteimonas sp. BDR2-5]MCD9029824.1 OprO/OprP family phosphate-selective porin [Luteimonas sp. BDR2-5]